MTRRLKTAVVGLNHYHVTGWVESLALFSQHLEVVARYDGDASRATRSSPDHVDPNLPPHFPDEFRAIPFYDDLERLYAETQPALALVTLPNRDAPDAIIRFAELGVHAIADKPLARNANEAAAAVAAARLHNVKLAVAFTRRYGAPWQEVSRAIAAGALGRLLSVEAMFVTSSVIVRHPGNAIFRRELMGGGILLWLGIHDIDLIQWLSGEQIVRVQGMAGSTGLATIDVEEVVSASFQLERGAIGTVHFAYALPGRGGEGFVALHGSERTVRIDANGATAWIAAGTPTDPLLTQTSMHEVARLPGYGSAGAGIIQDAIAAIQEDRDPLATGEHALAALRVIDAIYESARTGDVVDVRIEDDLRT